MALFLCALLCVVLLDTGALGFGILPGESQSHQEITEQAILNATVYACRHLAQADGTVFNFPPRPFTASAVAAACGASSSSKSFRQAILAITLTNVRVDIRHALNASFHFDDEMFVGGRKIITEGILAVKASNKQENFEAAREKLGEILHPLQDFYSHSNWVELGKPLPNANLIRSDTNIGNMAAESRATCRNCDGDNCTNNILDDIINEEVLTSGYFGIVPVVSTKPKGKCSHGGAVDQTSTIEPKGGINKDSFKSSHGHLHTTAANMAVAATSQLLEDIRAAADDRPFLAMMGISKGSSKALCLVIDTTESMSDDIDAVKSVTSTIINSEVGTEDEPSLYILVPFNDPDVGPLIRTKDPENFKKAVDLLSPSGGGDEPEMSLSGLELALTVAPFNSEIFLFTDSSAKDAHLKTTVMALIERTQCVVNFLITDTSTTNRDNWTNRRLLSDRLAAADAQVYRDVAQDSGGQFIEVTKSELPTATSIIIESSSSSLVTILQTARKGTTDVFPFIVDETVTKLRIYITGRLYNFTLTSPSGETQKSTDSTGTLIASSQSAGNFQSLQLKIQKGQWKLNMASTNPYTVKIIGQSPIDFLFDFVVASQGPFSGFDTLQTRPKVGVQGNLMVTVTGSDTATVTEVALVQPSGSGEINGTVEAQEEGTFLVQVDRMPTEFVVRIKGSDSGTSKTTASSFQRQSSTVFRASNVTISADSNRLLTPGTPLIVPFSVTTSGDGGNFTIRATNSRRYESTFPTSLFVETGQSSNGTVTLSAPRTTPSGTDVTLTIEAEAPGGQDTNYVMLRFSVLNTVTDFKQPECKVLSHQSNCSGNCSSDMWEMRIQVTDGSDGTGVDRVSLRQGNGTMNVSTDSANEKNKLVSYVSPCCSHTMELVVVDRVGNVGSCSFSRDGSTAAQSASARITLSPFLCLMSMLTLSIHVLSQHPT